MFPGELSVRSCLSHIFGQTPDSQERSQDGGNDGQHTVVAYKMLGLELGPTRGLSTRGPEKEKHRRCLLRLLTCCLAWFGRHSACIFYLPKREFKHTMAHTMLLSRPAKNSVCSSLQRSRGNFCFQFCCTISMHSVPHIIGRLGLDQHLTELQT